MDESTTQTSGGGYAKRIAIGRKHNTNFRWRIRKAHRHWTKAQHKFLVAMRLGETPVLIPNTMVKT